MTTRPISARRIAVLSLDTRGGVQPYIALALGLQRAGHRVHMLAPTDFVPMIEAHGIWVSGLSGNMESALRGAPDATERGPIASIRFAARESRIHVSRWMAEALEGCRDVDVITGGIGGMIVGESVAEKLGVPFVQTHLQPVCASTGEYPGVLFPGVPRWTGALGRRLSHPLSEFALWAPFAAAVRAARRDVLGLSRKKPRVDALLPVLYGYSAHVVPRPVHWPATRRVTGYWSLPHLDTWEPELALQEFLHAGPPPVCIGFGSMTSGDPAALTELVTGAVRKAGARAVLLSGWGGLHAAVHRDVFVTREVPHDWLLPQMSAVVHHGGAGTTAAACAAGVPQLVVPFTMDQPFWASRVERLGVAAPTIPRQHLTVDALATGIRTAVATPDIRARARILAAQIGGEDGVAMAVSAFDSLPLPVR
jgi:sterol 3beta-glucosyltransferase